MNELIVRCSSIGALMAEPVNADIDPEFVNDELRAIIALKKRTSEQQSILEEARANSLSAGAKTHVRALLREDLYGYTPSELRTFPVLKGKAVEQECIEMLSRLTGQPLVKNTERRTNGLISGECDLWQPYLNHGRDVKAPYSMATMPISVADCYDSTYLWQMRGYMVLWDADSWSVDYVLVDTPEEFIARGDPIDQHVVGHIDERHRWTSWRIERNRTVEEAITTKVLAARRYYREILNEFDRTHGGGLDPAPRPRPQAVQVAAAAPAVASKPVGGPPITALSPEF